jgi:hypothetical protein
MSENIEKSASKGVPVWRASWPALELEHVPACPVCDGTAREMLHENLLDNVFLLRLAAGSFYRCMQCTCAPYARDPRRLPLVLRAR